MKYFFSILFALTFCFPSVSQTHVELEGGEVAESTLKTYNFKGAKHYDWDLHHLDLQVSFNWENQTVNGVAKLWLTPKTDQNQPIVLDAKYMDLKSVRQLQASGLKKVDFKYDSLQLQITPLSVEKGKKVVLEIEYIGQPNKNGGRGGNAVQDSKGLYFIVPSESQPNIQRQLWTQGETEFNSTWTPLIEDPKEKITHKIAITVNESFTTISNGQLKAQVSANGKRTDFWEMELPHAPYLMMMAVGPFEKVTDSKSAIPVNYFVEKQEAPYAKTIFGKTPEMIDFYGEKLGVTYPWPKYDQVVVRNFVSGAMENTTATIHGEFLYEDDYSIHNHNHEDIIAHELFHHWFGDLATCKSWPDIAMNEAFASYGEYLWFEHSRGKDAADLIFENDKKAYLYGVYHTGITPIVRHHYESPDELFDVNTYQKGARVLHQLRQVIGDEAFFKSLETYLKRYQFKSAEIAQFRMVAEEVSGQDLRWFFHQWFYQPGHPDLDIQYQLKDDSLLVDITQNQLMKEQGLFKFPLNIGYFNANGAQSQTIWVMDEKSSYKLFVGQGVRYVEADANHAFLGTLKEKGKSIEMWGYQLEKGNPLSKIYASMVLDTLSWDGGKKHAVKAALQDENAKVRAAGLKMTESLEKPQLEYLEILLEQMAESDEDFVNRKLALEILDQKLGSNNTRLFERNMEIQDYGVAAYATMVVGKTNADIAYPRAKALFEMKKNPYKSQLLSVIARKGKKEDFEKVVALLPTDNQKYSPSVSQSIQALGYFAGYGDIQTVKPKALQKLELLLVSDNEDIVKDAQQAVKLAVEIWETRLEKDFLSGKEREVLRNDIKAWKGRLVK